MACRTIRPRLPPFHSLHRSTRTPAIHHNLRQQRSFSLTSSAPEVLTAERTLPYSTLGIYNIITSIDSYPDFLPFLTHAHITAYSDPDSHYHRKWPQLASLTVGYKGQLAETLTSRVYCIPPMPAAGRAGIGIVEAVSGSAEHSLDTDMIAHHTSSSAAAPAHAGDPSAGGPLEFLRTRWTVRHFPFKPAPSNGSSPQEEGVEPQPEVQERTDVSLSIEYRFANPVYEALAGAASGRVAEMMIQAFEKRVQSLLGKQGTTEKDK